MPGRAVLIGCIGLALGALIGVLTLAQHRGASISPGEPRSTGVAQIGGPFELVDQDGVKRTDKDFRGKHMLVFFGFLYCPDICPATLQVVSEALDLLGPKQDTITPIFITVDPERDTPEALKTYLASFHPRLVGLTGSPEQVKAAAKSYRAYYRKATNEQLPDSYTIDHSTILYVMGPAGQYITHFAHGTSAANIAKRLQQIL